MLSTNVLCMKKRKKRSYYISEASDYIPRPSKDKRSVGDSNPAMMQITEDTPPDMLAGAMDLTVHLPTGRTVKMSVERSTPMMDLLVQITTAHHLQHSGHILQALEMAPTSGHTDKILPYKPNTPIGALDTQHVKVIPKNRSIPVPKNVSVGHQPFESTFRLQVHLPRNQLYVIRVSQNVHLDDIMKKVCDEKNLDPMKYEFRHPGNLDEVLDPKLTLSDYQITEVYIVAKGTVGLTQTFSTNDIMALRKEEERKQLQARTGGGVFSLIFKRGKPSMGSGSLSSENRSISPSHSDDSRSVTPPALQQQIVTPQEIQHAKEKPKPPQRKRRPAPKPPQQQQNQDGRKDSTDKPPSQISTVSDDTNTSDLHTKTDNGLTICHSRNSSDSSGYHEPSVLSDNCNTSLPRRPKSTIVNEVVNEEIQTEKSNGNLSKMSTFSKSTTSITSRKKKAAPPPPQPMVLMKTESSVENPEKPSPVVASPSHLEKRASPKPPPRNKVAYEPPKPAPRIKTVVVEYPVPQARKIRLQAPSPNLLETQHDEDTDDTSSIASTSTNQPVVNTNNNDNKQNFDEIISSTNEELIQKYKKVTEDKNRLIDSINPALVDIYQSSDTLVDDLESSSILEDQTKPPEVVAAIPKKTESQTSLSSHSSSSFDTIGRKRGFQIGSSMISLSDDASSVDNHKQTDDFEINNIGMFESNSDKKKKISKTHQELLGIHSFDSAMIKNRSMTSLRSSESMPGFLEQSNIKKWNNVQDLDDISVGSDSTGFGGSKWVVGDTSDTDSITTVPIKESPRGSITSSRATSFQESIIAENTKPTVPEPARDSISSTSTESSRKDSKSSLVIPNLKTSTSETSLNLAEGQNGRPEHKPVGSSTPRRSLILDETPAEIRSPRRSLVVDEKSVRSSSPRTSLVVDGKAVETQSPRRSAAEEKSIENQAIPNLTAEVTKVENPDDKVLEEKSIESCSARSFSSEKQPILENDLNNSLSPRRSLAPVEPVGNLVDQAFLVDSKSIEPESNRRTHENSDVQVQQNKQEDASELENDWQYQLPPPPTAFRDTSPTNLTDITNYDTVTIQDFKESVITNPELFEKLQLVKQNRTESEINSDYNSVISDEEKPMLNKLTLENLEKRKSLVYNRELSTSLKVAQEPSSSNSCRTPIDDASSKRSSILSELEEVIQNGKALTKQKQEPQTIDSSLPNFKISTYDQPKRKINIFEDDSVRSNVDASLKTISATDLSNSENSGLFFDANFGKSMDNIPYRKSSTDEQFDEDGFRKPQEFGKYKSRNFFVKNQQDLVGRSESFSSNVNWKPHNPVQRSKSQVALNVKQDTKTDSEDNLTKCNSLFDVSGLQSLEVMRLIQTKLKTPTNSIEQLPQQPIQQISSNDSSKTEPDSTTNTTKTYKYQGPPAINLSTWSERPKTKISLKEDTDYKIKNSTSIEVRHYNGNSRNQDTNSVSIKINGTEPITTQESGNVVIKIGEPIKNDNFSKFVQNSGYRKPLGNVNKIDKNPRPHSIAFDANFDINRVPIVRSVELKKPYKESNTSVTQINTETDKYADIYKSSEAVTEINGLKPQVPVKNSSVYLNNDSTKPVIRVSSFAQNRTTPVVMGFRSEIGNNDNTARSRKSWNVPTYGTLPLKVTPETPVKPTNFIPNSNVPFSQHTLKKRTEIRQSSETTNGVNGTVFGNVVLRNASGQARNVNNPSRYSTGSQFTFETQTKKVESFSTAPPPPIMPKFTKKQVQTIQTNSLDSRDELLSSIRNFGGINGLKNIKA